MTRLQTRTFGFRRATISRSCAEGLGNSIRYGSTTSGGLVSSRMRNEAKRPTYISTTIVTGETMLVTKRKPASIAEILTEEFMTPMALTQQELADAMGVPRKHVNELCNDRRSVTAPT